MGIIKTTMSNEDDMHPAWLMWVCSGDYDAALEHYKKLHNGNDPTHVFIVPRHKHKASVQMNYFAPAI